MYESMKSKHTKHTPAHGHREQAVGAAPAAGDGADENAAPGQGSPTEAAVGGPVVPPSAAEGKDPEKEALKERLLRLQADFENFRKRTLREKTELYRLANEDLMIALLPVLDHLDLAMGSLNAHGDQKAFVDGVRLVWDQVRSVLGRFGLTIAEAAAGDLFDPNCHEAISHLPSAAVPENHVSTRVRPGYLLGEKLLRPVQVVVSSGPPAAAESTGPQSASVLDNA
jgi:molecular chaperone GrpE